MKRLKEVNQEEDSYHSIVSSETIPEPNLKKQLLNNSSESSYYVLGDNYFNGENGVENDYEKAYEFYLKGAEEGCVKSMYQVGYCYDEGLGVEHSDVKAFEWFLKAAENGLKDTDNDYLNVVTLHVGKCYEVGKGVEKDISKALEWFMKAAVNNDSYLQFNIGVYYEGGYGIEQDYSKAFEWYLKSAGNDHSEAQYRVGLCYEYGQGVEKDMSKAFEWYLKSAENGETFAQVNVGVCFERGEGVEQDYAKAFNWYLKSAENGHKDSQYNIGYCYQYGEGVKQDDCKAFEWYFKCANNGHNAAQYSLGRLYDYGDGVEQDYGKAFEWYLTAAEQGNNSAQNSIGHCYEFGQGVEKDYSKAMEWYLKAAAGGNEISQNNIGRLYKFGKGVEKDLSKAFKYIMNSAENGCKLAQREVGMLLKYGKGVEQDVEKSFYWLAKGLNRTDFKVIDFNEFGIAEFKNDDIIERNELTLHESDNELISKVIIRFKEKDFEIGSNYLSSSKYLTTMMSENWRNFNQKVEDKIILDLTAIENEIFQQETDYIQIFEMYIKYLMKAKLPNDFKLDLKLKLIELSRYLGDDQCIIRIMRESNMLTRYCILFKLEMIQPIHNMMASCCSTELRHDLPPEELEILLSQSELSSLAKRIIFESFFEKNNKYPNSIIFSKLINDTILSKRTLRQQINSSNI